MSSPPKDRADSLVSPPQLPTSTESMTPSKEFLLEYRSYLRSLSKPFPFFDLPLEWKFGWIVAEGISIADYDSFCSENNFDDLNLRFQKEFNFEFFRGQVVMSVRNTESCIHAELCLEILAIYAQFADNLPANIRDSFTRVANYQLRSADCTWKPDVQLGLLGLPKIIVEVAYSQKLSDAHFKMQEMLKLPTVKAGILIKVRYPWNKLHENHLLYDPNDGLLVFLFYEKPENYGNPSFTKIPAPTPGQIINFGNEELTEIDIAYISNQTQFTGTIEGYGITSGPCSESDLEDYTFEIPLDGTFLTDEIIQNFPPGRNLIIDLFRLKRAAGRGVTSANGTAHLIPLPKALPKLE